MMGRQEVEGQEGIIPMICSDLFRRIEEGTTENLQFNVSVKEFFHNFFLYSSSLDKGCSLRKHRK